MLGAPSEVAKDKDQTLLRTAPPPGHGDGLGPRRLHAVELPGRFG